MMTFGEQVCSHLDFLRSLGLAVEDLVIDSGIVRCRPLNPEPGKFSQYAYRTSKNSMAKYGMVGLVTWCRGTGGREETHKTYGLDGVFNGLKPKTDAPRIDQVQPKREMSEAVRKWLWMWKEASDSGSSDYLNRKDVGSHGIRFNQRGAALVPAHDRHGTLCGFQFLNPDGSKRFPKGVAMAGLFHELREPANGEILGVAESYVTAATCMELSAVPVVCAFSSGNLLSVCNTMREKYPLSRIVVFADNDRHLDENKGVVWAEKATKAISNSFIAVPDFGELLPNQDASDWNDLVRLKGRYLAKSQIENFINRDY